MKNLALCLSCQTKTFTEVAHRDAKSGEPLSIVMCTTCGLVQQSPIPSAGALRQYYSHNYREEYKGTTVPRPKHIFRAAAAASDRLDFMGAVVIAQKRLHPGKLSLIDIGAGGGEFVCLAARKGYNAVGIEPNLGYSDFARRHYGVDIQTLQLDQLGGCHADCVTLFHVLEHLSDPLLAMATLYQVVKPSGYLFIEVPNIEQADASPANIFFKAHLFYFSQSTLISIASQFFEPVSIEYKGNLRVIFRRRDSIGPRVLPTSVDVQSTVRRLKQKGWTEYLTTGRGISKLIRRSIRYWSEFKLRDKSPLEIIEFVENAQT
jgi:2-polyprenyl-3-methyl-5-hydroxy-6-metoxy-1,4-benzoquinol methylase